MNAMVRYRTKNENIMDIDDVLAELGEMGKYQIKVYILLCLPILFSAANSLSYVFTAGVPKYRCFIPNCENATSTTYDVSWLKIAVPHDQACKPLSCTRYQTGTLQMNATCTEDVFTNDTMECDEWVFGQERTIVNDWNITCPKNQWKLSLVASGHFAGILVGTASFGVLADRCGRKKVLVFCILLVGASGFLQIASPGYVAFVFLVFVNAFGTAGVYPSAFILGLEMVGKTKRELAGMVLNYFYAIGEASLALIAWGFEDWVILQIVISAPCILFAAYHWVIPESVRWLLAKEKHQEARSVFETAAKYNNVKMSNVQMLSIPESDGANWLAVIKSLLRSRKLVVRFVIIVFVWSVNAFVYYGLSLKSISVSGNKYLNFALVCLVEIPGYTMSWICMEKLGRKSTLKWSFLLCGITCVASAFVPTESTWMEISLFLLGKLGVTSSFGVAYVHTAEILPTVVRSGGVGTASTIARIGATLAPFVPLLGVYYPGLPMVLFGGVALMAGFLSLNLPETLGMKLPENIEDAERI